MDNFTKFSLAFLLSVVLHFAIVAPFGINFDSNRERTKTPTPEIIQASALDEKEIMAEATRLKKLDKDIASAKKRKQQEWEAKAKKEKRRLQLAEKKRRQQEDKIKSLDAQTKRLEIDAQKAKAQKERLEIDAQKAKAQKQRLEQETKQAKLKQRRQEQAILAKQQKAIQDRAKKSQQLAAQKLAAKQARQAQYNRDKQTIAKHAEGIKRRVTNRWIKPLSARKDMRCELRVKLLPSGEVMQVTVTKSSGNAIFDRSAENAAHKASPLAVPKDRILFNNYFRVFTFDFKPEKREF